jgi:hypothetical protein
VGEYCLDHRWVFDAMIRSAPPQAKQVSMSMLKTRLSP